MIRVLSVIHYPVYGGPHNRNAHVIPILETQGIKTIVLLPDEPGNAVQRLESRGIDVVSLPLSRLRATLNPYYHVRLFVSFLGDIGRIRKLIRDKDIDLVQVNGLVNLQAGIAARLEGIPVVWQILDTYTPVYLRKLLMPVVTRLSTVIMCTGKKVAREHSEAIVSSEKLVLFYPPVDLVKFRMDKERRIKARATLGIAEDVFVVGNVGNINLQKGHGTFIRAAARLKKVIPSVKFVILGATHANHAEYAERLWKEASELGLEYNVDLIVKDPKDNVAELESAFDVFWMTSEPNSEGIPTSIEEAMSLGIPVVSTNVGSISEIVLQDTTGFVVEPYDIDGFVSATAKLHDNPGLKESLGNNAREFAGKHFDSMNCSDTHLHAYKMALKDRLEQ